MLMGLVLKAISSIQEQEEQTADCCFYEATYL